MICPTTELDYCLFHTIDVLLREKMDSTAGNIRVALLVIGFSTGKYISIYFEQLHTIKF